MPCDCTTCAAVRAAERQCERADVLARALLEAGEQLRDRDARIKALEEAGREADAALDRAHRILNQATCSKAACVVFGAEHVYETINEAQRVIARLAALVTTQKGDDQ